MVLCIRRYAKRHFTTYPFSLMDYSQWLIVKSIVLIAVGIALIAFLVIAIRTLWFWQKQLSRIDRIIEWIQEKGTTAALGLLGSLGGIKDALTAVSEIAGVIWREQNTPRTSSSKKKKSTSEKLNKE